MIKRRRRDKIVKKVDNAEQIIEQEEKAKILNDEKQHFRLRIQNYERKCEEIRRTVQNKTDRREERINAEVADQKRKEIYLAAVEKVLEEDGER